MKREQVITHSEQLQSFCTPCNNTSESREKTNFRRIYIMRGWSLRAVRKKLGTHNGNAKKVASEMGENVVLPLRVTATLA